MYLDLIDSVTKAMSQYIDRRVEERIAQEIDARVEKKVGEVLASHDSMKQIDENFEKRIIQLANAAAIEAIDEHCANENHKDEDDIESVISDHDFSDQVYEAVNDAINDHDFSDDINAALADYDLSDHVRSAMASMQFKVSVE